MKRVLLFVVDGCTSRVLRRLVDDGALPTIAALGARGTLAYDCLSIFPSITPAATDRVSYYGDDVWTVLQRGVGTFVRDFLLRLTASGFARRQSSRLPSGTAAAPVASTT